MNVFSDCFSNQQTQLAVHQLVCQVFELYGITVILRRTSPFLVEWRLMRVAPEMLVSIWDTNGICNNETKYKYCIYIYLCIYCGWFYQELDPALWTVDVACCWVYTYPPWHLQKIPLGISKKYPLISCEKYPLTSPKDHLKYYKHTISHLHLNTPWRPPKKTLHISRYTSHVQKVLQGWGITQEE